MEYAQLNLAGTDAIQVTTHGNVEWDANHFCPASALTEEESAFFRVVPLLDIAQPAFDTMTQSCFRDGCEQVGDKWQYKWTVANLPPEQAEANQAAATLSKRTSLLMQIDADADAIYAKALGNRATEYAQAETDANVYKAAGFTGTVPAYVQAWAAATGKSATWATDDILTTSTAWRSAMAAIRFNRLGCKESARSAVDMAALEVVKAKWDGFVAAITTQLGV